MEEYEEDYLEEEDFYSGKKREKLVEDDEITPEEEAFMQGWEEA